MSSSLLESQVSPIEQQRTYTPEDLLRFTEPRRVHLSIPDGHRFELIDGKLVERNLGALASQIALNACRLVGNHVKANKLGKVFASDCGYQIFGEKANRVRYPDGSFVARGRLPDDKTPSGHMRIAPDWAVEVVSPK